MRKILGKLTKGEGKIEEGRVSRSGELEVLVMASCNVQSILDDVEKVKSGEGREKKSQSFFAGARKLQGISKN